MPSILIVDDDVKLCEMLEDYFARHDIVTTIRHDGERGLETVNKGTYDLMLLDVMLPGMDGLEVLRHLRQFSDIYVLLLTARGEPADRISGLRLGADDYLPKPFDLEELFARIQAILRRCPRRIAPVSTSSNKSRLQRAGLTIDVATRTVSYGSAMLDLTNIEVSLLETFLQSPGVVLTREELIIRVFQRPFHPLDRSLDMYVSRLRRKLRTATPLGNHIKTIRSSGYLFSTVDSDQGFC